MFTSKKFEFANGAGVATIGKATAVAALTSLKKCESDEHRYDAMMRIIATAITHIEPAGNAPQCTIDEMRHQADINAVVHRVDTYRDAVQLWLMLYGVPIDFSGGGTDDMRALFDALLRANGVPTAGGAKNDYTATV